jgi:hypothetical protein
MTRKTEEGAPGASYDAKTSKWALWMRSRKRGRIHAHLIDTVDGVIKAAKSINAGKTCAFCGSE